MNEDNLIIEDVDSDFTPDIEVPEVAEQPEPETKRETEKDDNDAAKPASDKTVSEKSGDVQEQEAEAVSDSHEEDVPPTAPTFPVLSPDNIDKLFGHFLSILENPEEQVRKNVKIDADLVQTISECSFPTGVDSNTAINAALRCFLLNVLDNLSSLRKVSRVDSLFAKYLKS